MSSKLSNGIGSVVSLRRYPVKSMLGDELSTTYVTENGIIGGRAYAVIDRSTGKVASAKFPPKWGQRLDFHATFVEPPSPARPARPTVYPGVHMHR